MPVGLLCTAASGEQVAALLACMSAGVDWYALYRGELTADQRKRLMGPAMQELSALPIFIADCDGSAPTDALLRAARRMVTEHCVSLVIVDHVDPTTPMTEGRGREAVEEVRGFRSFSRELNLPVIIYQHGHDVYCGSSRYIYRASDLVISVSNRGRVSGSASKMDWVRVSVEKNRNGPAGFFSLLHNHRTLGFEEVGRTGRSRGDER